MRKLCIIPFLVSAAFAVAPINAQEQPLDPSVLRAVRALGIRLPETVPADWQSLPRPTAAPPAARAMAPWPTIDWTESTPAAQNMTWWKIRDAVRYAQGHQSKAVLVFRNGYLVAEWYAGGWNRDTKQKGYSMAKSFTSALYGILLKEGQISGLDQKVSTAIPAWGDPNHADVDLEHLLSMTSGIHWDWFNDYVTLSLSPNQNSYSTGQDIDDAPGTLWTYSNMGVQMLSKFLNKTAGMQPAEFAAKRLGRVIGMWDADWMTDFVGNTLTYQSVIANGREFGKFGYLFLRAGEWDGQQVIPAAWVAASTQPSQTLNPFYGYLWWLNTGGLDMPNVPADAYYAAGLGEKRIYVVPSLDLVVVRLGNLSALWEDNRFLGPICDSVY